MMLDPTEACGSEGSKKEADGRELLCADEKAGREIKKNTGEEEKEEMKHGESARKKKKKLRLRREKQSH